MESSASRRCSLIPGIELTSAGDLVCDRRTQRKDAVGKSCSKGVFLPVPARGCCDGGGGGRRLPALSGWTPFLRLFEPETGLVWLDAV